MPSTPVFLGDTGDCPPLVDYHYTEPGDKPKGNYMLLCGKLHIESAKDKGRPVPTYSSFL